MAPSRQTLLKKLGGRRSLPPHFFQASTSSSSSSSSLKHRLSVSLLQPFIPSKTSTAASSKVQTSSFKRSVSLQLDSTFKGILSALVTIPLLLSPLKTTPQKQSDLTLPPPSFTSTARKLDFSDKEEQFKKLKRKYLKKNVFYKLLKLKDEGCSQVATLEDPSTQKRMQLELSKTFHKPPPCEDGKTAFLIKTVEEGRCILNWEVR